MKHLPFRTQEQREALLGKRLVLTLKTGRMLVDVPSRIEGSYLFFGLRACYFYDISRIVDGDDD